MLHRLSLCYQLLHHTSNSAMDSYITTTLVGGAEGDRFDDIIRLTNANGRGGKAFYDIMVHCLQSCTGILGELIVDKQNAIRWITVSHGAVVSSAL